MAAAPDRFRVTALAAGGGNVALLAEQAARLRVTAVGVSREDAADALHDRLATHWPADAPAPRVHVGPQATTDLAALGCDTVLNAVVGSQGLRATLAALAAGRVVALANKESLIAGGPLVTARGRRANSSPVDSEHSALAQCLRAGARTRGAPAARHRQRRPVPRPGRGPNSPTSPPRQALAHPTWDMGPLITTNSATLVNKGLEVIEAHLLFGIPYERIDVVVHPQSMIHSMVEFTDGSTIAQASPPDMRLPISLALGWPDRVPGAARHVDWTTAQHWTFEPLDPEAFPSVPLARRAGQAGGCAPAVYNAANEVLVAAFHEGTIGFLHIVDTIGAVLDDWLSERHAAAGNPSTVEHVEQAEAWARNRARDLTTADADCARQAGRGVSAVPAWLLYTLGVLIFAFGLLLSIALHEVGHMVPAKKFGVKVTQYMVGFGPTVWSRKRGDTEYGVKAIPLGGYIRMIGMVPPRADGSGPRWPRRLATAVEDFRQVSRSEVDPADEDRQFYRLTPGKKMIVMLGGPCMNLVIYLVLFTILLTTLGTPQPGRDDHGRHGRKCVVPADPPDADTDQCPATAPPTPALRPLKPGDRFVSINGVPVKTWDQLSSLIRPCAGSRCRRGPSATGRTSPSRSRRSSTGTTSTTRERRLETVGFLGFSPTVETTSTSRCRSPAFPGQIGDQLQLGVDALARYPREDHEPVPDGVRGQEARPARRGRRRRHRPHLRRLREEQSLTVQDKVFVLFNLLAGVNLLLFFFNLLPLLPLDGGHVAGALVEAAKRGRARLRARPSAPRDGRRRGARRSSSTRPRCCR